MPEQGGIADVSDRNFDVFHSLRWRVVVPVRALALALAHRRHRATGTRPRRTTRLGGGRSGNRYRRTRAALRRRRAESGAVPRATLGPRGAALTSRRPGIQKTTQSSPDRREAA